MHAVQVPQTFALWDNRCQGDAAYEGHVNAARYHDPAALKGPGKAMLTNQTDDPEGSSAHQKSIIISAKRNLTHLQS